MKWGNVIFSPIIFTFTKKRMSRLIAYLVIFSLVGFPMKKTKVDLLVKDATIYTVDESFTVVEAFVVKNGYIVDSGTSKEMTKKYKAKSILSLQGKFVYPGWIDAHAHFVGYGLSLNQVDLMGTSSVEEIVERCKVFAKNNPGSWVTGRGWDQNDWEVKSFPSKEDLDKVFPDTPVLLRRVDGHAGWANSKALDLAGVSKNTKVDGGDVQLENDEPTGILIDNAIGLVGKKVPSPGDDEIKAGISMAEKKCFAVGLTSVADAGLSTELVQLIDSLHKTKELKMRVNAWLDPSESNFTTFVEKGVLQTEYLSVSTLKLYADGALGSRGARMIEPYSDDPENKGLFVTEPAKLKALCQRALDNDYQVAIHCIGDDANRLVLNIYSELLKKNNDRRWRIEHAQIIHPDDFNIFGEYNIIPSVQPTHATSDMYWAEDRIGKERMKGAYSYKTLLDQLGWIPNGSDFPVEQINPIYGFYSAVARKDHSGYPADGFRMEEALSREEALRGMTIWAAKSAFEEDFKGSIEKGKLADFVVTRQDIMKIDESLLPVLKVDKTYSGGKLVYENKDKN
jgi:predicted amidohydrolase YtcJ